MGKNEKKFVSKIGGQAVIEGVMMRGETSMATAVRDERGEILVEAKRLPSSNGKKHLFKKLPIIRGVFAFISSLVGGTKALMRSASVYGEDETSSFDNWVAKKTGIKAEDIAIFFGVFLGVLLSLFLFFFLPQWIADLFVFIPKTSILYYLIEGLIRILIFISYILLTSLIPDVKRTYMYHGAEHKTISCYENGEELTVSNIKKCSRVHDRCGTTFMFIVMIISILIFAIINVVLTKLGVDLNYLGLGKLWRFLVKLATLPIVAGVSYEILKLLAKTESKWFLVFKLPGLLLQRITTKEPDDKMIEVASVAFNKVLEMDNDQTIGECEFNVYGTAKTLLNKVNKIIYHSGEVTDSDGEWIVSILLNVKRSEVNSSSLVVTKEINDKAIEIAKKRASGTPLWYIFGETEFYGYKIKVDKNVLIPRPETEELCSVALKDINSESEVLDMCTGSGAIAIAVQKQSNCKMTGVDISLGALEVAKENATINDAEVTFISSDLFSQVNGVFDVIISNPPYIKTEDISKLEQEVLNEPYIALDGGNDGCDFYRKISKNAHKYLKNNGKLFLEIGCEQGQLVLDIFKESGYYKDMEVIKDLNSLDRIVKVVKND